MGKSKDFYVKKYDEDKNKITVEEEKRYRSPFILFLINNGKLIFTISLLLSISVFIIAITLSFKNIGESSVVMYESNGVVVSFNGSDNSIINGTPITKEYAEKVFYSNLNDDNYLRGVVIKVKEIDINGDNYIFYSDKTVIIKYNDGSFKKVYPLDNKYAVNDKGEINSKAIYKDLSGEYKKNSKYDIDIIYLSDGSVIVIKDNINFYVRNSDITNNDSFYTNLSGVSSLFKVDNNIYYYSNGIIKEDDFIIVNGVKYSKDYEKDDIFDNIKVIYYDNGYAEVICGNLSIMVEKSEHIKYNNNIFEIIDNNKYKENIDIKDIMDIKNITLKNTNDKKANYMVVLEESSSNSYSKYDISKRLDNKYIFYNTYINSNIVKNKILDNSINIADNDKNNYLICEGIIDKLSEISIDIGMWVDYENITSEYMNSGFVGTIKVYIESK